jgi:DNA-binding CsgD family transcriptional regulator
MVKLYEPPAELTPRQIDVLRCASHGLTTPETAEALGIAYNTAKTLIRDAHRRLGAKTTAHAVARTLRLGLID